MQSCRSLPQAVALVVHLSADGRSDLGSGFRQVSQLRRGRTSRLHCCKPNPFDVRSWKRGNALPGVVEAILLEELLNAAPEALADEGVAAVPDQTMMNLNMYDIQEKFSLGIFGLCATLGVVIIVGVCAISIQDFLQNRKLEQEKKKREQAKKEEMKNRAALPVTKKSAPTGPKRTPTGPAGFGQVSR